MGNFYGIFSILNLNCIMKAILILSGIICSLLLTGQSFYLYPFRSSEKTTKLSLAKFNKRCITPTAYYRMLTNNTLPTNYYVISDTIRPSNPVVTVSAPKNNKTCQMVACLKKDTVTLFEIWQDLERVKKNIHSLKHHVDLTGDGINEVFVYYSYYHHWDDDMTTGRETINYVDVWDPEKKQLLLSQVLSSNGNSWSMCNGGSSHSSSMNIYFYPGGFSVLNSHSSNSREYKNYSEQSSGKDYYYTPAGFITDTLNPCLLHFKDKNNQQELCMEFKRLKSIQNDCPGAPGLFRCIMQLVQAIPYHTDSSEIIQLLGPPDKVLNKLPAELAIKFERVGRDGSQFWIYPVNAATYLFFSMADGKTRFFYWYTSNPNWL